MARAFPPPGVSGGAAGLTAKGQCSPCTVPANCPEGSIWDVGTHQVSICAAGSFAPIVNGAYWHLADEGDSCTASCAARGGACTDGTWPDKTEFRAVDAGLGGPCDGIFGGISSSSPSPKCRTGRRGRAQNREILRKNKENLEIIGGGV